jgi:hypothetical protein
VFDACDSFRKNDLEFCDRDTKENRNAMCQTQLGRFCHRVRLLVQNTLQVRLDYPQVQAEPFPDARKPALKLTIEQITAHQPSGAGAVLTDHRLSAEPQQGTLTVCLNPPSARYSSSARRQDLRRPCG